MTDHTDTERRTDFDAAARALETRDTLRGEFTINGETYDLLIREPTLGELQELEDDLGGEADEAEAIREMVDEYLEQPQIDPDAVGVSKLFALFEGMREAWQAADVFDEAESEMPIASGNRGQTSLR
jgi:hypothetical protein